MILLAIPAQPPVAYDFEQRNVPPFVCTGQNCRITSLPGLTSSEIVEFILAEFTPRCDSGKCGPERSQGSGTRAMPPENEEEIRGTGR